MKKYKFFPVVLLWFLLAAFAWFAPNKAFSDAERRPWRSRRR